MSRTVSRRTRDARRVHQSAITHAEAVGARLDAELAAAGVDAPPAATTIRALGELIEVRAAAMERADRAHDEELADDAGPRHARDVAYEELVEAFANLRHVVGVVGNTALVKRLGLAGRTPRTPDELVQATKIVRARLADIPLPRTPGVAVDAAALGADLDRRTDVLVQALVAVDREAREAEATLQTKYDAIAAYDQAFSGAAAALSALFSLADEPELARRVRPSRSRPGQTAEQVDADAAGDAGGEAPAAAAPAAGSGVAGSGVDAAAVDSSRLQPVSLTDD